MSRRQRITPEIAGIFAAAYRELKSLRRVAQTFPQWTESGIYYGLRKFGHIRPKARPRLTTAQLAKLHGDYLKHGWSKAARMNGITRQALHETLKAHKLIVVCPGGRPAKRGIVVWRGMRFSPDKNGFLRMTKNGTRSWPRNKTTLHYLRWEELHGPVPPGHILAFKDFDQSNCDPSNLQLMTRREHLALMAKIGRLGNAWTVFKRKHDALLAEAQRLEQTGAPATQIDAAWRAYEQLERPGVWTPARKRQHKEIMKARWAARSAEDRKAILRKSVETRRRNREAKSGSVIDQLLAAA